jgi:hypothetical protein
MKCKLGVLLFFGVVGVTYAQNMVYLCVDADGKKEYRNTGSTKGCRKVDLPGLVTIAPPAAAANTGETTQRVGSQVQKLRDNDRQQILAEELKGETDKLAGLKREYNAGQGARLPNETSAQYAERMKKLKEDVARSEQDLELLNREYNKAIRAK